MNGIVPSPVVSEKALRLLEQRRVDPTWGPGPIASVSGDTGRHLVQAQSNGVFCNCTAGGNPDPVSCSHKVAAQIAWFES